MSESRTEARTRAGFTVEQRVALLESDMDQIDVKFDKLMSRMTLVITTSIMLAIAIFSAVVSVAVVR